MNSGPAGFHDKQKTAGLDTHRFVILCIKKQSRLGYFFSGCGRLAGGMIPFIRRYSTICP